MLSNRPHIADDRTEESLHDKIARLEREKEFAQIIADGDKGIRNEQAALLRECRLALDTLIAQKPVLAGFKAGSTTLGNLRASLFEHRPQGVMGYDDDANEAVVETIKVLADRYFDLLPKVKRLERENAELRQALEAALKPGRSYAELVEYILQDDIHNRLTPRVVDIAYSAWHLGRSGKNKDDGGPCDWFNDTKPMVMEQLAKIKRDMGDAPPAQTPPRLTDDDLMAAHCGGKDMLDGLRAIETSVRRQFGVKE